MGGIFSFLNTFFVGSLLMSVILVVMMLFQFRQRIKQLEEKGDTMLQIINSIVEKMKITELEVSPQYAGQSNVTLNELSDENFRIKTIFLSEDEEEEMENEEESGDEEEEMENEEESGDEQESGDEEEQESEDEEEQESEDEEEQEQEQESELVNEIVKDTIEDIPETIEVSETDVNSLVSDEGLSKDDNSSVFSKLTVSQLKEEVKNKGLASNISKLRKNELIELLATN